MGGEIRLLEVFGGEIHEEMGDGAITNGLLGVNCDIVGTMSIDKGQAKVGSHVSIGTLVL